MFFSHAVKTNRANIHKNYFIAVDVVDCSVVCVCFFAFPATLPGAPEKDKQIEDGKTRKAQIKINM